MRGLNALALYVAVISCGLTGCGGDDGGNSVGGSGGSGGSAGVDNVSQPACAANEDCDDGVFCNGEEACIDRACEPGVGPSCDDDIACTVDRCSEDQQACVSQGPDADGDGHADARCVDGFGDALGDDCDDRDSTRHPGALEVCDADDHDEDCDLTSFGRVDLDGDGYLNANCCNVAVDGVPVCGNDCDDANARIHPFNTESCDGLDNDCNGLLDHPKEDQDGDGFAASACGGTDCDDFDPMTFAGAMERCDGYDNDCLQGGGPIADENDLDSDSFVTGLCTHIQNIDLSPGDCDEGRRSANPLHVEQCNARDDDCDGAIDESLDCAGAVKQVDGSYLQTCAVRVDGTVACWGRNDDGALGTGSDDWVLEYPRDVIDPRQPNVRLSQVHQVAVGSYHACAVHLDGRVSCWGNNARGALGIGSDTSGVLPPTTVVGIDDAADVCSGNGFSCARLVDGAVLCWGANGWAQLGDGTLDDRATPSGVRGLGASSQIACGDYFACATTSAGKVRCWGDNRNGQLGDISTEQRDASVEVFGVEGAVEVTAGRSHACARRRDGTVMCWGDNAFGQIGNATSSGPVLRATQVTLYTGYPLADVVEVTAGGGDQYYDNLLDDAGNTCARLRNGQVLCWGRNHRGQLGYGEWTNNGVVPPRLETPRYGVQSLPDALQITTGHQHGCALSADGSLRCWGDGGDGQVPDVGSTTTPVLIEGL